MVQRRANRDLESTQQRRTDLLREVDERIASTERSIAAVERTLRRRETANVGILTIEPPSQGQIESIVSLNRT
ncbi:hypothetical protein LRR18_18720, partial [Mangrovimonas sp. AS39]|uniref:hypothetical protein n=1 Tax=Mangrovimonas futianensis TaxID=2895523 RepID=UPI001E6530DF